MIHPRELNFAQGSDAWLESRLGCLTGSIVGEIMPGSRGSVPATRKKLLYKKACEYLFGIDKSRPIPRMYADWGHDHEAEACEAVENYLHYISDEITDDVQFREVGLIKSDFDDLVASSLDRLSECGKYALEVKCPYDPANHLQHIIERPAVVMSSSYKNYYWQPRHHMLCTGAVACIWATYSPEAKTKPLHVEIIESDEDEMKLLRENCLSFVNDMKAIVKEVLK